MKYAESNNLFFLDDDNYLISENTLIDLLNLFERNDFIFVRFKSCILDQVVILSFSF